MTNPSLGSASRENKITLERPGRGLPANSTIRLSGSRAPESLHRKVRMTRKAQLLLALLILGLGMTRLAFAQDSSESSPDSDQETLADLATEAGTTAGIAAVCNADAASINSAFRALLHATYPDHASRHHFWQRYEAAILSTISTLDGRPQASCDSINLAIRDEIHRLTEPAP